MKDYYYVATENMKCSCGKLSTILGWDSRILVQLPFALRVQFPCVLTYHYACDRFAMSFFRSRTLGNSSSALKNVIMEMHSEEWTRRNIRYLYDCQRYRIGLSLVQKLPPTFEVAEKFKTIPTPKWLLSAYACDVWRRSESLKATITSTFGSVLKIDSTKKILKKLQGRFKDSASWVTNVGNEYGAIVQCIVTNSESVEALKKMADGIVSRYKSANVDPPFLLYTDRDCCNFRGPSKFNVLFEAWPYLQAKLDIWHFMRRIGFGCTSEQHPLYGVFMNHLSGCLFEWDSDDYNLLKRAKLGEFKEKKIRNVDDKAVQKSIDRKELARHCRRRTRGAEETKDLIERLILSFTGTTDALGVQLFKPSMVEIWTEQKRHMHCIQDPPGSQLYSKVGELKKGGISLPIYRCWRGSTSLESFHHHIVNFIPGTSANGINFQAYLLEGLSRWNQKRKDGVEKMMGDLRCFDSELIVKLNNLHLDVHKTSYNNQTPPNQVNDELIGIDYLTDQNQEPAIDQEFVEKHVDDAMAEDGGYNSNEDDNFEEGDLNLPSIPDEEEEEQYSEDSEEQLTTTDSRGIPGWDKVDKLAKRLIDLSGLSVSPTEVKKIVDLYNNLDDFDKEPPHYRPVRKTATKGRFGSRRQGYALQTVMKRSFLSGSSSPAMSPKKSRIVEAICLHLTKKITTHRTSNHFDGSSRYDSRWKLIIQHYNYIRGRLFNSPILEETELVLFNINETTLRLWFKNKTRNDEIMQLMQGKNVPGELAVAKERLPEPTTPTKLQGEARPKIYEEPEDRTGKAVLRFGNIRQRPLQEASQPRDELDEQFVGHLPVSPLQPMAPLSPDKPRGIKRKMKENHQISAKKPLMPTTDQTFMPTIHQPFQSYPSHPLSYAPISSRLPYHPSQYHPLPYQPFSPFPFPFMHAAPPVQAPQALVKKERKKYTCRKCGNSEGHGQYKGQRFCPKAEKVSYEEWLKDKRDNDPKKK